MEFKGILEYIRNKIKKDSNELSLDYDDSDIGKMFYSLLFNMVSSPFVIKECALVAKPSEEDPTELTVTGKAALLPTAQNARGKSSPLSRDFPATFYLTFRDTNPDTLYYELNVAAEGNYGLVELFGKLPPQYRSEKGYLELNPSMLSYLSIKNPVFRITPDYVYDGLPFAICGMLTLSPFKSPALPASPTEPSREGWEKYATLLSGSSLPGISLPVSGFASLRPDFDGYAQFTLMAELSNKKNASTFEVLPAQQLDSGSFFKAAGLRLYLESGTLNQNVFNDTAPVISTAGLGVFFEFKNLPPIEFSTPLFINDKTWRLKVHFEGGLGLIDILNFFGSLFQIGNGKSDLLLPADLALNNLKLYDLQFVMERKNPTQGWSLQLREVAVWLHTSKPWSLSQLPSITLENLSMLWHMQWGNKGVNGKRDYLFTGEIAATLTIKLPHSDKTIRMSCKAILPELYIEASLKLEQKSKNQRNLSDIMGQAATENLPGEPTKTLTLAQLDLVGSYQQRSLTIYAQVNNAISFKLGNVKIELEKIYAEASFTQQGNAYMLGGVITMQPEKNDSSKSFSISLEGRYAAKNWSFHGWLSAGRLELNGLIKAFFRVEASTINWLPTVTITEFDVRYKHYSETKKSDFSLTTAFSMNWKNIEILKGLIKTDIDIYTRLRLKKSNKGINYLSLLVALKIEPLTISMQADNLHQKDKAVYIFSLKFRQDILLASYSTKKVKEEACKILNISMKNITVGKILSWIVSLIDPNASHELPAPWNLLNKIDLSKFNLEINLTQKIVAFSYNLNLDILGIIKIQSIGASYNYGDQKKGKMNLIVVSSEDKKHEWDPTRESPPAIAKNPKKFQLFYLGIGQHYTSENVKKANSILSAINALKEATQPGKEEGLNVEGGKDIDTTPKNQAGKRVKYDAETNWTFGIECMFNEALRIRVVLNDPHLYGILITVESENAPFKPFNGLMLELLYKKVTKDIGMFKATLLLPERMRKFNLGVLEISIGIMSIEIYTNGNFLLDLGFPHNRNFSRSFGLQYSIFSGKGGLYFGILCGATCPKLPVPKSGAFTSVLSLGLGLCVGIRRGFDFGIVACNLSLELTGIFEGLFAIYEPDKNSRNKDKDTYYRISATVGITGRFFIKVDLFIISLEASATVSAFAMLVLESYKPTLVDLDLNLSLAAKVKIIFFTIEVGYNFSRKFQFILGEASSAPWDALPERGELRTISAKANVEDTDNIQVFMNKTIPGINVSKMALKLSPLFSLKDEKKPCVAFITSISKEDCINLIKLFTSWILHTFEEDSLLCADLSLKLTPQRLAEEVGYTQLDEFLAKNVKFDLAKMGESPGSEQNTGNNDTVYAFPMPPPVALSFFVCNDKIKNEVKDEVKEEVKDEIKDEAKDAVKDAVKDETKSEEKDEVKDEASKPLLEVKYWENNHVSDEYARKLRKYFASFDSSDDDRQSDLSDSENGNATQPFAQLIFLDYAHMLLRALMQQATGMGNVCQVPAKDFDCKVAEEQFGISLEQILTDNHNAKLAENVTLHLEKIVQVGLKDTFKSLAESLGIAPDVFFESNRNTVGLFRPGSEFEVSQTIFANPDGLSVINAAAFFFVRRGGFQQPVYYLKYVDNIAGQITPIMDATRNNPLPTDFTPDDYKIMDREVIDETGSIKFDPPDKSVLQWNVLPGDTVEQLAQFYSVLAGDLDKDPAWIDYRTTFVNLNQGNETNGLKVPGGKFTLNGAETPFSLYRKLFADNKYEGINLDSLLDKTIFRQNAALMAKDVPYSIAGKGSTQVKDVLSTANLTIKELAEALARAGKVFQSDSGDTISIYGAKTIPKEMILDALGNDNNAVSLCTTASRFLLQGLRVPDLDFGSNINGDKTTALYEALGQQVKFDIDDGTSWKLKLTAANEANWVTGSKEIEIKKDEIKPYLANEDFTWENYYRFLNPPQLPLFTTQARAYSLTNGLVWAEKLKATNAVRPKLALHPFSSSLKQDWTLLKEPDFKSRTGSIEAQHMGLLLTLSASSKDGIISIYGAGPEDRLLLKKVLEKQDANTISFEHTLFYKPSPLDGLPNTLIEITKDSESESPKSKLLRTNLSRETKMFARILEMQSKGRNDDSELPCVAEYGKENFLRLLWECSTVGGGGYYLCLANPPESNIYDENGNATLWLFIKDYNDILKKTANCINCAVTKEISLVQSDIPLYVTENGKPDQSLLDSKPTLPPGNYGVSLKCNLPDELAKIKYTQDLFSILGYKVKDEDSNKEKYYLEVLGKDSRPLLPRDETEDRQRFHQYDIIVPLFKMLSQQENPYAVLGKKATIEVYCRDVLGNTNTDAAKHEITIDPEINDLMIGLNEWPGVSLSYEVLADGQAVPKPKVVFHLEGPPTGSKPTGDKAWETIRLSQKKPAEQLQRSLWQWKAGVEATLFSSLFKDILFSDVQKEVIENFGCKLFDAMTKKDSEWPDPIKLEFIPDFDLVQQKALAMHFPLTFKCKLTRKAHGAGPLPQAALCAESLLEARIIATPSEEDTTKPKKNQSLKDFAVKFEAVLPGLKLAHKGNSESALYVVRTGEGGLVPPITIEPYSNHYGCDEKAPRFYAFRPLSNKPISRTVRVIQYSDDWEQGDTTSQHYANIDVDAWGNRFLGDVERCLEAGFALQLATFDDELINGLMEVKEKLATGMSKCLIAIKEAQDEFITVEAGKFIEKIEEDNRKLVNKRTVPNIGQACASIKNHFGGNLKDARNIIKDRLRKNLVEGNKISSVAEYSMTVRGNNVGVRLAAILSTATDHDPNLGATSAKLDLSKPTAFILLESKSPYLAHARLDLDISVQDVEYNIAATSGKYESSEWLRLVIPLEIEKAKGETKKGDTQGVVVDLSSDILAPNPLRSLPSPLVLEGQQCLPQKNPLFQWQHEISVTGKAIEQDSHEISITYSRASYQSKIGDEKDLFDLLCQYASFRDDILSAIFDKLNQKAFEIFIDLAFDIADKWDDSLNEDAGVSAGGGGGQLNCTLCYEDEDEDGNKGMVIASHLEDDWQVEVKTATPLDMIKLGEKISFSLLVNNLSIYSRNRADTTTVTTRNANLLEFVANGNTKKLDTAQEFIYRTEVKGLTPLYASINATVKGPIGRIAGKITKETIGKSLQILSDKLGMDNQSNSASLTVWYKYTMPATGLRPSARLPVSFFPEISLSNFSTNEEIISNIWAWYEQQQPVQPDFLLQFDLLVYSLSTETDNVLMSLEDISIEFTAD